jgi:hypothetical protein
MFVGPADSPDAVICSRVESSKRCGESGWLHRLRDSGPTWSPRVRKIELSAARITAPALDLDRLAADFCAAVRPEALDRLAVALGVSVKSLQRLGVGWAAQYPAWAFPMTDAAGAVLGIRLRLRYGKKISVKGGHDGLFIPEGLDLAGGLLLICEGPTDTAALLDFGFSAVGRPSCTGGVKLLVDLVQKHRPEGVTIVSDVDGNGAGQRGAASLAAVLVAYCPAVRIIAPPSGVKDAREWKRRGATAGDVTAAIGAAAVSKLQVSIHKKGRRR